MGATPRNSLCSDHDEVLEPFSFYEFHSLITKTSDTYHLIWCSVINNGNYINNEFNDVYLVTTLSPIPMEAFTLQVSNSLWFFCQYALAKSKHLTFISNNINIRGMLKWNVPFITIQDIHISGNSASNSNKNLNLVIRISSALCFMICSHRDIVFTFLQRIT